MSAHNGKSRHFTGSGASSDMSKYNAAGRKGWTIFRYPDSNKNLSAKTVQRALRDVNVVLTGIEAGQQTLEVKEQRRL